MWYLSPLSWRGRTRVDRRQRVCIVAGTLEEINIWQIIEQHTTYIFNRIANRIAGCLGEGEGVGCVSRLRSRMVSSNATPSRLYAYPRSAFVDFCHSDGEWLGRLRLFRPMVVGGIEVYFEILILRRRALEKSRYLYNRAFFFWLMLVVESQTLTYIKTINVGGDARTD
jgi:hypothetical protein